MGTTSLEASCIVKVLERGWRADWQMAYHARRGEGVPTQSDAVLVLDIAPLLFQGFVVHDWGSVGRECGHVVWIKLPLGGRGAVSRKVEVRTVEVRAGGARLQCRVLQQRFKELPCDGIAVCQQLETSPTASNLPTDPPAQTSRSSAPSVMPHRPHASLTTKLFSRSPLLLFSTSTASLQHYLSTSFAVHWQGRFRAVRRWIFTRCWAPAWKDRSDSLEMLGISRGYNLALSCLSCELYTPIAHVLVSRAK